MNAFYHCEGIDMTASVKSPKNDIARLYIGYETTYVPDTLESISAPVVLRWLLENVCENYPELVRYEFVDKYGFGGATMDYDSETNVGIDPCDMPPYELIAARHYSADDSIILLVRDIEW